MTKDQVIEHYNLVCRIEDLERFIKAMECAESVRIITEGKIESRDDRYLASDEIIDIRNIFQNKLNRLNEKLEKL